MRMLTSISPIDGRYRDTTEKAAEYFSEWALMRYRLRVEIEYFIQLCQLDLPQLRHIPSSYFEVMRSWYAKFSPAEAVEVRELEKITRHDIKALENFLRKKFQTIPELASSAEFIHFGLTSQDINNTAIPLSIREFLEDVYLPGVGRMLDRLGRISTETKGIPMLSRTHGQPATPTTVGKEVAVFHERLQQQVDTLGKVQLSGKFGGAVGNLNAHYAAFPDVDWHGVADIFLRDRLGLKRSHPTTQIDHYDSLAVVFDNLRRINVILVDLCRDMWMYISRDYFVQTMQKGQVGSSTMPHKVNPYDFENAEGNLGISSALLDHFSNKLPVSRLQRDLSDSTVLRNIGVAFSHILVAFRSIGSGLDRLRVNREALERDLQENWQVLFEAIQTILRREGVADAYGMILKKVKKSSLSRETLHEVIEDLPVSPDVREELLHLTPETYLGKSA